MVLADSRYMMQVDRAVPGRAPRAGLQRHLRPLARAAGQHRRQRWWPDRGRGRLRQPVDVAAPGRGCAGRRAACPPRAGSSRCARSRSQSEIERIAAACAVADAALERLLPEIKPGMTEAELALRLEWEMRTNGAEALAFDVACLSGPRAALPHGSPGAREIRQRRGTAVRFRRAGGRLSLGHDAHAVRRRAQRGATWRSTTSSRAPSRRAIDALAARHRRGRARRAAGRCTSSPTTSSASAGHGDHFGHGLGHGIGLATHELPGLGLSAADAPLPSPTVFSVEPGVYLEGVMGVRIEDHVVLDAEAGRLERLTPLSALRDGRRLASGRDFDQATCAEASSSRSMARSGRSSITTTSRWAAALPRCASSCATSSAARPWSARSRRARSGRAPISSSARSSSSTRTATTSTSWTPSRTSSSR